MESWHSPGRCTWSATLRFRQKEGRFTTQNGDKPQKCRDLPRKRRCNFRNGCQILQKDTGRKRYQNICFFFKSEKLVNSCRVKTASWYKPVKTRSRWHQCLWSTISSNLKQRFCSWSRAIHHQLGQVKTFASALPSYRWWNGMTNTWKHLQVKAFK